MSPRIAGDIVFDNQIFLIEPFQQTAAQAIHRRALLVHHVVILKQMFAGLEVLRLQPLSARLQFGA